MRSALDITDRRCGARRGDRPFEEHHPQTCITFVWSGSFTYRSGATVTTLGPGAVMLGNAGAPYVCSHEHAGGDRCLAIAYDPATIADIGAAAGVHDVAAPFRLPALPPLARAGAFAHALTAAARGDIGWSVEEVALELAAWVLREQAAAERAGRSAPATHRAAARSVDAMLWLDDHSGEPVTLADAAAVAGASPFHFLRAFRATIGVTPHQYLVRRRLAHAAAMLLDTDAPVTAVAYDAGFGDLAHFIRSFGRVFGCAPQAFRRAGGMPDATARNAKSCSPASR